MATFVPSATATATTPTTSARRDWVNLASEIGTSGQNVVLDHGGCTLKIGLAGDAEPSVVPNCAVRSKADRAVFIAQDVALCANTNSLAYLRPFDKGYCVNWDSQQTIFDSVFAWKKVFSSVCFFVSI